MTIKSYEVACSPRVVGDEAIRITPEMYHPRDLVQDPIPTRDPDGDVDGFVSLRDQLQFTIRPPLLAVTDYSGTLPVRSEADRLIVMLVELFYQAGLEIPSCAWEVAGYLEGEGASSMLQIFGDPSRSAAALGYGYEGETSEVEHIRFRAQTDWCNETRTELWLDSDFPSRVQFTIGGAFEELGTSADEVTKSANGLAALVDTATYGMIGLCHSIGETQ